MSILLITDGQPRNLGYCDIDNRGAGLGRNEYDTYTCRHCTKVVVLNPKRKRERYKCKGCNHPICDDCAADMVATGRPCYTMQQRYEDYLERVTRQSDSSPIILP